MAGLAEHGLFPSVATAGEEAIGAGNAVDTGGTTAAGGSININHPNIKARSLFKVVWLFLCLTLNLVKANQHRNTMSFNKGNKKGYFRNCPVALARGSMIIGKIWPKILSDNLLS